MNSEDEFVNILKKMEPSPKLRTNVMALRETKPKRTAARPLKIAVCCALLLAVLAGGTLFLPPQAVQNSGAKDYGVAAPSTGFTIVVNAATADGGAKQTELKPGREFALAPDDSISGAMNGGCYWDGKTSYWTVYYEFQLKCVGNDVEKVTYNTNRGEFQDYVRMNAAQKLYYDTHRTLNGLPFNKLDPAGGDMAFQPLGTVKTLASDSDGMLYLKLSLQTNEPIKAESKEENDFKFTTKYESQILEGTKIKITVFFKNGTQSEKTVCLHYPEASRDDYVKIAVSLPEETAAVPAP